MLSAIYFQMAQKKKKKKTFILFLPYSIVLNFIKIRRKGTKYPKVKNIYIANWEFEIQRPGSYFIFDIQNPLIILPEF